MSIQFAAPRSETVRAEYHGKHRPRVYVVDSSTTPATYQGKHRREAKA